MLLQTANGNVEAKVVCFYRRRDISSTLIALADKHASESPPPHQLSAPGVGLPSPCSLGLQCWAVSHEVLAVLWPGPGHESPHALLCRVGPGVYSSPGGVGDCHFLRFFPEYDWF